MEPSNEPFSDRYFTVANDKSIHNGWKTGWDIFRAVGSPVGHLDKLPVEQPHSELRNVGPLDLDTLWPDTEHYDQNSPGIMDRARDLDGRKYASWMEKAFFLNVLRVPICASYLAACAKVLPQSILELGTGGDSAHSTGVFLYWLGHTFHDGNNPYGVKGRLVSVDRHPLSRAWPRYRAYEYWRFIQGDSLNVMHAIIEGKLPVTPRFDMIFIDSSHDYAPTLAELNQASSMTDAMLMDDSTHPGVKQAMDEWLPQNTDWLRVDMHSAVSLLERHPKI